MRHEPRQGWASETGILQLSARCPIDADGAADFVAVSQVFARYGIAHDEVDALAMADLFAPDAVLEVSLAGPPFERHDGRDRIVANFCAVAATQQDQRRHAVTNIELTHTSSNTASARAYGIVSAANGESLTLAASCVYTADLQKDADGLWRFNRLWIGMDDYAGKAPGADI